ncbi:OsmC family protein [bacterium]|nr:OsmC family protein [bacterium]
MTVIECSYTGQLHCEAKHVLSGTQLHTDAPTDHDGLGQSFSPTDLIATALGTCVLTIMGITAKRQGWELGEATAIVEKTMTSEAPRQIKNLKVLISLPSSTTDEQRRVLKRIVNDCPVKRNLDPSITIDLIWS